MAAPIPVTFVGGASGPWRIERYVEREVDLRLSRVPG
jgi:hypothetical protein